MNVLVTGGAGFIGSHLVDALIERGHYVRILDNLEPQVHGDRLPDYLNDKAEFIEGDVADYGKCVFALRDADIVFHLAALVGVAQSMEQIYRYSLNTIGGATLLQAIVDLKRKPRKIIVASSMSIYGECSGDCPVVESHALRPASIYAITKRDHEEMFLEVGKAYSIPTVALRYFNTYGPRQALSNPYTGVGAIFANRILNGLPPIIYEDGEQMRDFIHVSDNIQANLLAMDSDAMNYQAFNVGTGLPVRIIEVANTLIDALGSDVKPVITGEHRHGDIRHCYPNIMAIKSHGFIPKIDIYSGLREYARYL